MTDSALRTNVTRAFAKATAIFADAFYTNAYEVLRAVKVDDGSGGQTETETVIETGRCQLSITNRLGAERVNAADIIRAPSAYTAEWLTQGAVTESDTLRIDGTRTFNIVDLKRDDAVTYADLEEI